MNNKISIGSISKFGKKEIIEIIILPIVGLSYLFIYMKYKSIFVHHGNSEAISTSISLIVFGLVHIVASNALSFLYNTNKIVIPIQPLATPKRLKILGSIIIGISILVFMNNY